MSYTPLPVLDSRAPVDHAAAAATFTADDARTDWHDGALWHVREKRDAAVAKVPEWEALRETASEVKEHTLSHLADYLEQFEAAATANGVAVHWARDAAEHNRIVGDILGGAGATRLVKAKSMLTEECSLNPYLEAPRHRGRGHGPGRADRAVSGPGRGQRRRRPGGRARRRAEPHRDARDPPQEGGGRDAVREPTRDGSGQRRPGLPHPPSARAPARPLSPGGRRADGRQLRRRRNGRGRGLHQRRQRRPGRAPGSGPDPLDGHREGDSQTRRPGRLHALAGAERDRPGRHSLQPRTTARRGPAPRCTS